MGNTSSAVVGSILGVGPCADVGGLLLVVLVGEIGDTVVHSDAVGSIAEVVREVGGDHVQNRCAGRPVRCRRDQQDLPS